MSELARDPDFAWLVAPCTLEAFFAQHWESAPLYLPRDRSDYFAPLFTRADFDAYLQRRNLHATDLRVVRMDRGIPHRYWTRTRSFDGASIVDPDAVWRLYEDGCSVILKNIQDGHPGIGAFARMVGQWLGAHVELNVFATPPVGQSFAMHYDATDIVMLQIEGAKHWRVGPRVEPFPLAERHVDPSSEASEVTEYLLTPGDLLYLPSGTAHEVRTLEEASLHITMTLAPQRRSDLLVAMAAEHQAMRRPVPTRLCPTDRRRALLSEFVEHARTLASESEVRAALDRHRAANPDASTKFS